MINTLGPYILVLLFTSGDYKMARGGLAMQEFPNFESCKAAIVQLEVEKRLTGYCIAKEVK